MKLAPTQRQKKRYILFKIESKEIFNLKEVENEVLASLKEFLGIWGLSQAVPLFLKENFTYPYFVLKVRHKWVDHIKSALLLNKTIKKTPCLFCSIITSGTIKAIKKKIEELNNEN